MVGTARRLQVEVDEWRRGFGKVGTKCENERNEVETVITMRGIELTKIFVKNSPFVNFYHGYTIKMN